MGITFQFNAYICDANEPYIEIATLGTYYINIGEKSDNINDFNSGTYNDTSWISNITKDPAQCTGTMLNGAVGGFEQRPLEVQAITQGIILLDAVGYNVSDYRLKLVQNDNILVSLTTLSGSDFYNFKYSNDAGVTWNQPIQLNGLASYLESSQAYFFTIADSIVNNVISKKYFAFNVRYNHYVTKLSTTPYEWSDRAIEFLNGLQQGIIPEDADPYSGAGDSGTGGGDGTFDGTSDTIDYPPLPTLGATDAGFVTLFSPTPTQLKALASYMWAELFSLETFKKLFNDPMDCILGLSVVPVDVPTSGAREITVGNVVTTVSMNVASQQYVSVDCGTVDFTKRYFGSYLDFEPYTKISIFLPYCGTHQLNADDIMGKVVGVRYNIDILTGSCVASIKCGESVKYEFNGAVASNIPVNSINYASTIENAIRIAVNIGTTVATAGASAPAQGVAETAEHFASRQAAATAANVGRGVSTAGSTAEGALSMKPNVGRSGAMGGGTGLLGHQIPYFIISRPRLCKPKNQDFFEGYPSFIQTTVGDLVGKGYTQFARVIVSSQYLTDDEEGELEDILKGGVYL